MEVNPKRLTARLDIKPGRSLTDHARAFRSESRTVIGWEGEAVLEKGKTLPCATA